jgi:hypothetical protein
MGSILLVMLLKFAYISFPAEVSIVNGRDKKIHLVRGHVIMMRV